ncbi:unnamed protein product, partial [Didymodactylos carnosus]
TSQQKKLLTMEKLFSDELFVEFFQYLPVVDLFRGFYNLNVRLNSILMDPDLYLCVNLFQMTRVDYQYLDENNLLDLLQTKIVYLKTDDWYSVMLCNRRGGSAESSCSHWKRSQILSNKNLNSYPNLRSLTIVRPDNMHFQQLIDLPTNLRQKLICLKLYPSRFGIMRVRRRFVCSL